LSSVEQAVKKSQVAPLISDFPLLSIIIVNWNGQALLGPCLSSVVQDAKGIPVETWLVDNASTDGSVDLIRSSFPQVYLIENRENVGFGPANNQAAALAGGRYLLFLNPDTELLPGALSSLLTYAEAHPKVGAVGPRILNADRSHQRSCWRGYPGLRMALIDAFYLWKVASLPVVRRFEYFPEELAEPTQVDHLLGACLLIRSEVWQKVGAFDEGFFLFSEETDWCWRAKRAGWQLVYYPYAEVIHYSEHSGRQQPATTLPHLYRSYCRFYRKRYPESRHRMVLLKGTIALASLIRLVLWSFRAWRCTAQREKHSLAQRMIGGYRQVLCELFSF
jgi:hypothetical protein